MRDDALILMQFRDTVAHLKGLPLAQATEQMGILGRPYFDELRARHDFPTAVGLLRDVWNDIQRVTDEAR